ncbi:MAG: calcium-binding protein [Verrucomicrobia bacterium]|nr:calcium-binding protein [Verrucomicrobiota bacterium]
MIDVAAPDKIVEDTLAGSGTDRIEVNSSFSIADPANPPIGQAATGEFSGIEQLFYTGAANITLTGNALKNVLQSDLGNDWLDGGAGNDTMIGGAGNDTYVVEGTGDVIIELAGGGIDQINSADDVILPASSEVENILLLGILPISAAGSSTNNLITGNSADNALRGELGDDTLIGNAGNDLLDGGLGSDCLIGGAGNDTYILDAINYPDGSIRTPDTLVENSGEGTDEIRVAAPVDLSQLPNFENVTLQDGGDFEIIGNAASNVLKGNTGNNLIDGGTGSDNLIGGAGNDTYIVDNSGDIVLEDRGGGTDNVVSYLTSYTLPDNVENLDVKGGNNSTGTGNTAPNVITGNQFDNVLKGLGGADTLVGGLGNDCLDGGNDERLYDQTEDRLLGGGGDDTYMVDNYQDAVVEIPGGAGGKDTIELYPTLLSLDLTISSYTYSINNTQFSAVAAASGTHVQFYLDKLQTGDLNYDPFASVPDDTAPALGSFELDGNYFYAMPDNVEDLTVKAKAITVNRGQFLIGPEYAYGNAAGNYITATSDLSVANDLPFSNYIDGQGGNDTMVGGLGNDTYIVDSSLDVIVEQPGEGTDLVRASTTYDLSTTDLVDPDTHALTSTVENLTLLDSAETIVGGRPALAGLGVLNFDGYGNSANNVITGNSGNNSLTGAGGNDTISGGGGSDTIDGGTGNDNIDGGVGNDSLVGGAGNDCLVGGAGINTLVGGAGDDTYVVASLADTVLELPTEGTDLVKSSVNFSLVPNPDVENLTLTGVGDINGAGNALGNVITGNTGNNLIDGGAGVDTMIGGAGDDTFVVSEVADVVSENAGGGADEVQAWVSYDLSTSLNIENLTLLGTAVNGTGNAGDNVITGNALGNILNGGGAGLGDTLIGGVGDDTYIISNNLDVIIEAAGDTADEVISSAASYTLADNVENLTLLAGAGDINGIGNNYDNLITGNAGNNTLDGGAGDNTLVGGLGNDTYIVASESETIIESLAEGTDEVQTTSSYTLGTNLENLRLIGSVADNLNGWGNSENNQLIGDGGDNHLFGYAGNDTLDGGLGNDTMVGGLGNDTYVVAQAGDVVAENLNQGTDLVQTDLAYTLGNNVENLTLTGAGNINGTGNALDNVINGNTGNNSLDGGLGNNTLIGGLGDDTLIASLGNDSLDGGTGNDNLNGGDGSNTLLGGSGDDTLLSGTGNDTLDGGDGNDSLTAGDGNNSLAGGLGNDTLLAGVGADILDGGAGNDSLDGGTGADVMIGGTGNDTYSVDNSGDTASETTSGASGGTDIVNSSVTFTLGLNIENLTLTGAGNINGTGNSLGNVIAGNAGDNILDGGNGRDTLDGGLGNDTLLGGALQDSLTGGGGNDSLDGGADDDFLLGTSAILAGSSELDTLTGGTGGDAFVLGDATSTYYDTAAAAGDYALITDFSVATNDQLQLKTLAASGTNVNGYVVGTNIYAAAGAANSWLYRDTNNNSTADAGDNLIAAIQATGGSGAGGALTTNDLNTVGYFV